MASKTAFTLRVRFLLGFIALAGSVSLHAAAPTITNISPSRGPTGGGTTVFISGTGFTDATQVTFGGVNASSFAVQNDGSIQASTPPSASAGVVDVVVSTTGGSVTVTAGFGYGNVPVAIPDTYSTPFNVTLSVNSPGVLSNDDPNAGGGWVAELVTNVANGTLNFTSDGGFVYTPNAGFIGEDTFTYRSQNSTGFGNAATVTIAVAAPPAPLPPTDLYAAEIRGNTVTLRWTPPPFGLTPTSYVIEGGPTPGSTLGTFDTPGPGPLFTFDAPTGTFFVRVRTRAGAEISGPSNEIPIFVNTPAVPSAPANFLTLVNGDTLSLAWRNSYAGGQPTAIVLDVTGSVVASLPLGFMDSATFAGVPAGTYNLSLRATNASGTSFPTTPVTVTVPSACTGVPAAPGFAAYKVGTTIYVVWDPAAAGAAPTSYVLNVTGSFIGSFPTTARGMSGSVGAGTYTLSVVAVNACGASAAAPPQTVTIP